MSQAYHGTCIIIPTKHAKSIAIAPPFWAMLGASVLEYYVDTDTLGTFSGEVEREGNALECARRKCECALELLGDKVEYCIASEGGFGPHPQIPFLPCDQQISFLDRKRGFHLHMVLVTELFIISNNSGKRRLLGFVFSNLSLKGGELRILCVSPLTTMPNDRYRRMAHPKRFELLAS
ncbi:MAG: DUF6671 family protein [Rickettsiales bacterium]